MGKGHFVIMEFFSEDCVTNIILAFQNQAICKTDAQSSYGELVNKQKKILNSV